MKSISRFVGTLARPVFVAAMLLALMAGAVTATPARAATIIVNTSTDEYGAGANCSLREAIQAANANAAFGGCPSGAPGADTITLPAGTFTLTLANAGANEDNNATGDLDILESLTINGAGSGITIIQAGTNNTNGIDKVIAANPVCTSVVNVTIDGVTIRYGRNTQPFSSPDFSHTGGGIDYCAGGGGGTFTLSNSVVSDNTNINAYGGGLNTDAYLTTSYTVNITNVTFSNNRTTSTVNEANGGAINIFGDQVTATITGSTFSGNSTTNTNSAGGAIHFRPSALAVGPTSSLNISGSTFSSNTAAGSGGAIATNTFGTATTVSIQTSSFTSNTATNSFGGALYLNGSVATVTPFSLSHLTITGNTAGSEGGGVYVGKSNVNMSKSFIVGNTAPTASGLRKSSDVATATVENNWWGCSTGPGAAPCDIASTAGGTLDFTPWYRNQLTATTSPLVTNQSTSLTASFLTNSAGSAVPAADVSEIVGKSVTWAASSGSLSATQSTVQAAGTATGTFQAAGVGSVTISAKVSNDNTVPVSSNVLSLTVNKANTTTAITSDTPDPSVTGQPVTVSYTVTGAFGNSPTAPTGNVTVSDGTDSCTATVADGQCTITFRTAGAKSLTATYVGDSNFNGSASSPVTSHTVNKANTTTLIVSSSPNPSVTGQAVTYNVTVSANAPGAAVSPTTITGSVTVSDGGSNSCIATLTAGAGSCTITYSSTAINLALTGAYGGDANFNGSTSSTHFQTINKANTTTTITSDAPDSSIAGQTVTVNFSVAVTAPGAGTPSGNVTVSDGVDSCIGTVASGTCDITLTTIGARTLTASYEGDANFNGSTSSAESHTVDGYSTTTAITSDAPDASVVGQSVTVQFTVTTGTGTPTGNVTVSDGTDSCVGTVAAGQCVITFTSVGTKSLTATYDGDLTHVGSVSAAESHQVNQASTTTAITSDSPDPSAVGQSVTVNFTVSVTAPGSGTPTGNVNVSDGVDSCTGTVASGTCSITLTTSGARTLTATYLGDGNFASSASGGESHFVDGTAPDTSIDSFPTNPDSDSTPAFQFSGSDPGGSGVASFECKLDAGAYAPCVSPYTSSSLSDGAHTFYVRAIDAVGNTDASPASYTWTLDATAPDTIIDTNPSNPTASASAAFTFHGDDGSGVGGLTFECKLDSGSFAACISPQNYTGLADGSHTFQVRASDSLGNVDATPASFTWTVDTSAPDTTITGNPTNPSNDANPSFTFTGNDGGGVGVGGFECSLDAGAFAPCPSPQNYAGLGAGPHTFAVRASDSLGNVDPTPATYTWQIDLTTPGVTVNQAGPDDPTTALTIHFTAVFTEPVTGFGDNAADVTLGGSAGATTAVVSGGPVTYDIAVSGMTVAGDVTVTIPAGAANDLAGNINTASSGGDNLVNWLPDTTDPNTSIDSHPSNPSNNASPFFAFSGTDNITSPAALTFECQLDSGGFSACASPQNYAGLSVGFHTFDVRAVDQAGNADPTPASYTWEIVNGPTASFVSAACTDTSTQASGRIRFLFDNPSGNPLTITLASNTNPDLVRNRNVIWMISGSNVTVLLKNIYGKNGVAVLTLNVSDGLVTNPVVITVHVGGNGNDVLTGTTGLDFMFGLNGDDTISGSDGSDVLCGGMGNDTINGEADNDYLDGAFGNDVLDGGANDDYLRGHVGVDTMTGGLGADFFSGGLGTDTSTDYNPSEGDTKDATTP